MFFDLGKFIENLGLLQILLLQPCCIFCSIVDPGGIGRDRRSRRFSGSLLGRMARNAIYPCPTALLRGVGAEAPLY